MSVGSVRIRGNILFYYKNGFEYKIKNVTSYKFKRTGLVIVGNITGDGIADKTKIKIPNKFIEDKDLLLKYFYEEML